MNDRELHELLKKGEVYNQYLLISDEPLLIEGAVKNIKGVLKVNESFDLDSFSISETSVEDIISKLYVTPFTSERRLIIVKNLEEMDNRALVDFAEDINMTSSQNCLVMTYTVKKHYRKYPNAYKKISGQFKKAKCVTFQADKARIHKWITAKVQRDHLNFSPSVIRYLEDEFANDITGLKNEFEKIENYLHETNEIDTDNLRNIAKGLCDFNKYQVVDTFLKGGKETIRLFEELRPYLRSYAEIVDALTRGLVFYTQQKKGAPKPNRITVANLLDEIVAIDQKVKKSSYFTNVMLELFFLKNADLYRKGVIHGRQMARATRA